jgi:hypothetical protein
MRCVLDDQQLGGVIKLLSDGVAYLRGELWLTGKLLRDTAYTPEGEL